MKQRLVNIGTYSFQTCLDYGLTGVMARSCGIKRDLRLSKTENYANYYYLNFRSYIGQHGDCYDRFLIRMNEMSESLNIINQSVAKISKFNSKKLSKKNYDNNKFNNQTNILPHLVLKYLNTNEYNNKITKSNYNSMEDLITHFKLWSKGIKVQPGYTYQSVESPKGEFGVSLLSDGSNKPYKCKVRSPAYHHLQVMPKIGKGHFLADLVTLVGTVDIVFGEIDR